MMRLLGRLAAGCCCAALVACGTSVDTDRGSPSVSASMRQIALPKPDLPWDEDFAASITLERIAVGEHSLLVPKGLQLPDDAVISAATEATVVFADDDPDAISRAIEESCLHGGYDEYAKYDGVTVWVGHGMALRLEIRSGAQVLAWAPEHMKDDFVASP